MNKREKGVGLIEAIMLMGLIAALAKSKMHRDEGTSYDLEPRVTVCQKAQS